MNIGDRVRLLHGKEQGVITRFLSDDIVEVAIDNEFAIPVRRREVVVVAADEAKAFHQEPVRQEQAGGRAQALKLETIEKGIYLAFVQQTPELLALHLINNTNQDLLFTYGQVKGGNYSGQSNGKLLPKAAQLLSHHHLGEFEQWPDFTVQLLQHHPHATALKELQTHRLSCKANSFYKSRRQAPVVNTQAFLFQLDQQGVPQADAARLQEKLASGPSGPAPEPVTPPAHEIDLHIDQLTPDHKQLAPQQMLDLQIQAFETALDRAIAFGMHEIIFIHGAGSGVLRKEIQKRLSQNRQIRFFEDARKEKFGYGATRVQIA